MKGFCFFRDFGFECLRLGMLECLRMLVTCFRVWASVRGTRIENPGLRGMVQASGRKGFR